MNRTEKPMEEGHAVIKLLMDELNWAYQGLGTLPPSHSACQAYDRAARLLGIPSSRNVFRTPNRPEAK
jgi:hypothetical protein